MKLTRTLALHVLATPVAMSPTQSLVAVAGGFTNLLNGGGGVCGGGVVTYVLAAKTHA